MPQSLITGNNYVIPINTIEAIPISQAIEIPVVATTAVGQPNLIDLSTIPSGLSQTKLGSAIRTSIATNDFLIGLNNLARIMPAYTKALNIANQPLPQGLTNTLSTTSRPLSFTPLLRANQILQARTLVNQLAPQIREDLARINAFNNLISQDLAMNLQKMGLNINQISTAVDLGRALVSVLPIPSKTLGLNEFTQGRLNAVDVLGNTINGLVNNIRQLNVQGIKNNYEQLINVINQYVNYIPQAVASGKLNPTQALQVLSTYYQLGLSNPQVYSSTINAIKNQLQQMYQVLNMIPNSLLTSPNQVLGAKQLGSLLNNPLSLSISNFQNNFSLFNNLASNPSNINKLNNIVQQLYTNYNNAITQLSNMLQQPNVVQNLTNAFSQQLNTINANMNSINQQLSQINNIIKQLNLNNMGQQAYLNGKALNQEQIAQLVNNISNNLNNINNMVQTINTIKLQYQNLINNFRNNPTVQNYLQLVNFNQRINSVLSQINNASNFLKQVSNYLNQIAFSTNISANANEFMNGKIVGNIAPVAPITNTFASLGKNYDKLLSDLTAVFSKLGGVVLNNPVSKLITSVASTFMPKNLLNKLDPNTINATFSLLSKSFSSLFNTTLAVLSLSDSIIYNQLINGLKGFGSMELMGWADVYNDVKNYVANNWPIFAKDAIEPVSNIVINELGKNGIDKNISAKLFDQLITSPTVSNMVGDAIAYSIPALGPLGHLGANPNEPLTMKLFDVAMAGIGIYGLATGGSSFASTLLKDLNSGMDLATAVSDALNTSLSSVLSSVVKPVGQNVAFSVGMNEAISQIANLIEGRGLLSQKQAYDALMSGIIFGVLAYPLSEAISAGFTRIIESVPDLASYLATKIG